MGKKLYVGNLDYGVTDGVLEQLFAAHGTVESAPVIIDRDTGRSKGFGFVEMNTEQEARAAIAALNGAQAGGRSPTVNGATPRADPGGRRGGGGRGGRGGWGAGGGGRYWGRAPSSRRARCLRPRRGQGHGAPRPPPHSGLPGRNTGLLSGAPAKRS